MPTAGFTETFDVAELVTYAFFLFFALLVYYLRREDKREGYPLDSDRKNVRVQGWPPIPPPKSFVTAHEGPIVPYQEPRDLTGLVVPSAHFQGAPLMSVGDPMRDGVGVASYCNRAEVPDLTFDEQLPKIVPLRVANGYYLAEEDPDPRGMQVVAADGIICGTVKDAWVDRSETFVRYLEVVTTPELGGRTVLVPMMLVTISEERRLIRVRSVLSHQLAAAPGIANPDQVTLREEDRISGYFASGHVYATPQRTEPFL
ncbi:MAG TPA: photosynthetic reaction center subunit H [Acetobacteraceae bacterium]|jgi:photosynthetic reaction center H subunit|nr:photosynthetic reaction center subunit H [Acetobacteraceae bacterium]